MERPLGSVLITGVTGFLGGHLAATLRAQGVQVRGTGRNPLKGRLLEEHLGMEFVPADLAEPGGLGAVCAGIQTVFHTAALAAPWGASRDFVRANVDGTRNLWREARQAGVTRWVQVSTPSLYFRNHSALQVQEDAVLPRPVNAYARTKREAELVLQDPDAPGPCFVILRPRALIGAGDSSILPRLVRALERGRLPVIGDGQTLTDLTCVENAVDALLRAATAPENLVSGRIFNISNGNPVRLWEILTTVAQKLDLPGPGRRIPRAPMMALASVLEGLSLVTGREPMLTRYGVSVLSDSQTLDIRAARRDLGYRPEVPLETGIDRFVQWWREGARYPFVVPGGNGPASLPEGGASSR